MFTPMYDIINAAWDLPALIKGVEVKVWENPDHMLYSYWEKKGWLHQVEEIQSIFPLLTYELLQMSRQLLEDFPATDPKHYAQLRTGLAGYAESFLKDGFIELLDTLPIEPKVILDYCGGDGQFLLFAREVFPDAYNVLLDRNHQILSGHIDHSIATDFEKDSDWGLGTLGVKADLVFLNEILHCKDEKGWEYLLTSSHERMAKDGVLIVGEQTPSERFQWRMDAMTSGGSCIAHQTFIEYMERHKDIFTFVEFEVINKSHWYMVFKKI